MNNVKNHVYPNSEDELVSFLKDHNSQILSGGTDLSINTDSKTETLIDVQKLPLRYIKDNQENFLIGSLTTAYEIYTYDKFPQSLRDSAFKVSDMPLLHAVTIGGNIAKLYPWCDLPPMLWALNASVSLLESNGERKNLTADEFFAYSRDQNVSNRNSFIKEIIVPKAPSNSFSQYQKFGLTEIDKGQVNVASYFVWDDSGTITEARIVVSAITKTIERLQDIENRIIGKQLNETVIQEIVEDSTKSVEIVPNYKSSADFRSQILRTYLKRTLTGCMEAQN